MRSLAAACLLCLVLWLCGVGQLCVHYQATWQVQLAQVEQRDRERIRKILRKHGVVAIATDWSHCVRLNGEVFKLKEEL